MIFRVPRDFYKSLFDNMVDGLAYCQMIFNKDRNPIDFIIIKVNKNFETLTGLTDVMGKNVTEVIPSIKTSNPELFEIYGKVSLTGESQKFEVFIEPLSRWFFVSVFSPKREYFVAVFQNITDRKQIEINLANANIAARNVLEDLSVEKLKVDLAQAKEEAILFSIGDGVLATDEKGNIVLVNKAAEKMLGRAQEELMGKFFSEVILEDERGTALIVDEHPISKALAIGAVTAITTAGPTYYCVRADKTRFAVAITVTPVLLNGRVIGAIKVFRDITKEKEVDKAKSEFVSLASHQLRTPLTTISWYTEMILSGDVGQVVPEQKKYLEEIYQGNRRMVGLVNTLLDVSRIELGTFRAEPKPTDVIALAQSVLDEQKQKIEKKKLIVVQKFGKDIPTFSTDPKLLRMVFQNILMNALEYTPPGGRIEFTISFNDKILLINVSDTGYGIPKNQQDRIFTKLFRADNVRDKDVDGTGLGLYIVKSVVENSGGKVWFKSPSPATTKAKEKNPGTTFYVALPLDTVQKKESHV